MSGADCPICSFALETCVKEFQCGHEFHQPCIDDWLEGNGHCPSCNGHTCEIDPSDDSEDSEDSAFDTVTESPNFVESIDLLSDSEVAAEPLDADLYIDLASICPICLETLTTEVKSLWCHHIFHIGCIDSWMEFVSHCPQCMGYV